MNYVCSRLNYLFLSVLINEYAKKYAADTDYRIKKSVNTDVGRIRVENILSYKLLGCQPCRGIALKKRSILAQVLTLHIVRAIAKIKHPPHRTDKYSYGTFVDVRHLLSSYEKISHHHYGKYNKSLPFLVTKFILCG